MKKGLTSSSLTPGSSSRSAASLSDFPGSFRPNVPTRSDGRGCPATPGLAPAIIDVHGGININFAPTVSVLLEQYFFWRESTHDSLYNAAGGVIVPGGASSTNYVGSEFDALLTLRFDRHWSGYVGYSHFFAGDFISDTGPSEDIDFVYAVFAYTF